MNNEGKLVYLSRPGVSEIVCCVASTFFILSVYRDYFFLSVYGHDEVHYYEDFRFKLLEEGRWVNYLLHDVLRAFPIHSWSILFITLSLFLFYRLLADTMSTKGLRVLFATCVVVSPPFVAQSLWPATTFPSIFILLLLTFLLRKVNFRLIYILSGALLFGAMQNYYFMVPLFFIPTFLEGRNEELWASILLKHAFWWVLGCVVGVLLSILIVYFLTGQLGLKVADWRHINPIKDFQGALQNLRYVTEILWVSVREFLSEGIFYLSIVVVVSAAILNFVFKNKYIKCFLVILAVALSYFAFSWPLAPVIQTRTLLPLATSLILALIVFSPALWAIVFNYLALAYFCVFYTIAGSAYIQNHKSVTDYFYSRIYNLIDREASQFKAIIIRGKLPENNSFAYFFNSAPLMHSVIYSLGASSFWDCREGSPDPRCNTTIDGVRRGETEMQGGKLVFYVDEKLKLGILQFSLLE